MVKEKRRRAAAALLSACMALMLLAGCGPSMAGGGKARPPIVLGTGARIARDAAKAVPEIYDKAARPGLPADGAKHGAHPLPDPDGCVRRPWRIVD